jgi:hypothetical protein
MSAQRPSPEDSSTDLRGGGGGGMYAGFNAPREWIEVTQTGFVQTTTAESVPVAPPPFDSSLEGSPLFNEQNPIPTGITYTRDPQQQILLNQPTKYQDGTDSGDYATGVVEAFSINVSGVGEGALGQEVISPIKCEGQTEANIKVFNFDKNGQAPDEIGAARHFEKANPNAGALLAFIRGKPHTCTVKQEIYVGVPNRGLVFYQVNQITISNVDRNGGVGDYVILHNPGSITPTIIR